MVKATKIKRTKDVQEEIDGHECLQEGPKHLQGQGRLSHLSQEAETLGPEHRAREGLPILGRPGACDR